MPNTYYQKRKEEARNEAIEWQSHLPEHNYSMEELGKFHEHFTELGRRFGLLQEFRENGIIEEWWK